MAYRELHVGATSETLSATLSVNVTDATGVEWRAWRVDRVGPPLVKAGAPAPPFDVSVTLTDTEIIPANRGLWRAAWWVTFPGGTIPVPNHEDEWDTIQIRDAPPAAA